jgi:outer membrane protein assembly factor BamB
VTVAFSESKRSQDIFNGGIVCPSSAENWQDVAYSPVTKLFYARVTDSCGIASSGGGIDPLGNGSRWMGGGGRRGQSAQETMQKLADIRAKYPTGPFLRGVDLATGRKVWDYNMGSGRSTGVLATAGNLLFLGGQGGIVALDARTGENLWHVDVGQNKCDGVCQEASAMTYMVGGKQYVAMPGYGVIIAYALAN